MQIINERDADGITAIIIKTAHNADIRFPITKKYKKLMDVAADNSTTILYHLNEFFKTLSERETPHVYMFYHNAAILLYEDARVVDKNRVISSFKFNLMYLKRNIDLFDKLRNYILSVPDLCPGYDRIDSRVDLPTQEILRSYSILDLLEISFVSTIFAPLWCSERLHEIIPGDYKELYFAEMMVPVLVEARYRDTIERVYHIVELKGVHRWMTLATDRPGLPGEGNRCVFSSFITKRLINYDLKLGMLIWVNHCIKYGHNALLKRWGQERLVWPRAGS